jgi:NADH-quinone oxidoreductase subunit M
MPPLSIMLWLPAACGVLGAILCALVGRARAAEPTAGASGAATASATGAATASATTSVTATASAASVTGPAEPEASTAAWSIPGVLALIGSFGALGLAIGYIADYSPDTQGLTHVTDIVWISELGIHYKLGISGLNVFMIGLTTLLFAAATIAANMRTGTPPTRRPQLFWFQFMLAESAVLGAFLAQDLALFVAFFDLMLIPFYFLTGVWGRGTREERTKATIKLVIYTFVGSLLMLAAAIATGVLAAQQGGGHVTFVLSALQAMPLSKGSQEWIFLFFAAAFLVKMPAFPLHGWMPDGYRAMPIEVLMVFSGVLSKVGAYGFLAIVLPLYPQAAAHFQTLMLIIALASILYGSVVAFTQTDARLIAGYSSVAQLGFITLGIFALNPQGAQGALLQMVNHGLVVAPLLFIVAILSRRAGGSEDVREMGGIAFRAPVLASIFLIVSLATLAMPGSANFVGEFLILLGVFKAKLVIAIIAFSGVVMASVYALRLFIRAMHNRVGAKVDSREISIRDGAVLVPLVVVIVFMAIYPQLALRRSEGSTKAAVAGAQAYTHQVSPAFAAFAAGLPNHVIHNQSAGETPTITVDSATSAQTSAGPVAKSEGRLK